MIVIPLHFAIASVCVPVCTYFEALHFYPPASHVSVSEAHLCWDKSIYQFHGIPLHFSIASVCVPVRTHFEARIFIRWHPK
mgnify:CR=1 FL=1